MILSLGEKEVYPQGTKIPQVQLIHHFQYIFFASIQYGQSLCPIPLRTGEQFCAISGCTSVIHECKSHLHLTQYGRRLDGGVVRKYSSREVYDFNFDKLSNCI